MNTETPIDLVHLVNSFSQPLNILNRDLHFVYANKAYLKASSKALSDLIGEYVFDVFPQPPDRQREVETLFRKTLEGETTFLETVAYQATLDNGEREMRYWRAVQEPYRNENGEITHLIQRSEDVTARHLLQQEKEIISAELKHRFNNAMTVLRSVARVTAQHATDVTTYSEDFIRRLESMSHTYAQLAENGWHGLTLTTLLRSELGIFMLKDKTACTLDGPPVPLSMNATKDMSLIIHELATNAAKYGCFSDPAGRLEVNWEISDDILDIRWQESGLENVTAPSHEGFGTKLFQLLRHMTVDRTFEETGVQIAIRIPVVERNGEYAFAA